MSKKDETKFKEKFRPRLDAIPGSWWVKVQQVCIRGMPDFLGCIYGRFVAIELKKDERHPDKLQSYTMDRIAQAGGITYTACPENADEIIAHLTIVSTHLRPGRCLASEDKSS